MEKFELTDIKLDDLNRNVLDRVRNALKTSFLPLSSTPELTNLWNTVMSLGPDSISGGDLPKKGTTFNTWLDAMISCANGIRESMLKLLPYLGDTLSEKWKLGPPVDPRPNPFDSAGNTISAKMTSPNPSSSPPPSATSSSTSSTTSTSTPRSSSSTTSSSHTASSPYVGGTPSPSTLPLSGGGGGGGLTRQQRDALRNANKTLYHCQACGRTDAWHPDGLKCAALRLAHEYANPLWATVNWADSVQGRAAIAKGISFAFVLPPSKKGDIGLNDESEWEGFESSHLNSIGEGCRTNIIIPF